MGYAGKNVQKFARELEIYLKPHLHRVIGDIDFDSPEITVIPDSYDGTLSRFRDHENVLLNPVS